MTSLSRPLAVVTLLLALAARADTVTLKNGKQLHGLVTRDSKTLVCIESGGAEYVFLRAEVKRVRHEGPVRVTSGGSRLAKKATTAKVVRVFTRRVSVPPPRAPVASAATPDDDGASAEPTTDATVTVYGTSWCAYCRKTRAYLRKRGVAFRDLDVEKDPAAAAAFARLKARAHLGPGVPVVTVGDAVIQGFDRAALDAALGG